MISRSVDGSPRCVSGDSRWPCAATPSPASCTSPGASTPKPPAAASSSISRTVGPYTVTASGFDLGRTTNTPHELFYKLQGANETGLGLAGTSDHELTLNRSGTAPTRCGSPARPCWC